MEIPIADVADRWTILCLKHEHGQTVILELERYGEELGKHNVDCAELSQINEWMWEIEDKITAATGYYEIGRLYKKLRDLTLKRVAAKNAIAREHGGVIEEKTY